MDPTQQITGIYQQALGRAPDEQGLQFWSGALNQGYTPEQIQAQLQASEEGQKYLTGIATPNNAGTVQTAAPPVQPTGTVTPRDPSTYSYGLAQNGATGTAWRDNPAMTQLLGKGWENLYSTWQEIQRLQATDPFAAESKQQYLDNMLKNDPVLRARFEQYTASPVQFYKTYGISDGQFLDPSVMEGMASIMQGQRGIGSLLRSMQTKWGAARAGRTPVEDLLAQYGGRAQYTGNTGVEDWLNEYFNPPRVSDAERGPRQEGANWMQPLSEQEAAQIREQIRAANAAQGGNLREVFDGEFIRTEPIVIPQPEGAEETPATEEQLLSDEEIQALVDSALAGQGGTSASYAQALEEQLAQNFGQLQKNTAEPVPIYGQGEGYYEPTITGYSNPEFVAPLGQDTASLGSWLGVQPWNPNYEDERTDNPAYTARLNLASEVPFEDGTRYGYFEGIYDAEGKLLDTRFVDAPKENWFEKNFNTIAPLAFAAIAGPAALGMYGPEVAATSAATGTGATAGGATALDLAAAYDTALTGVGSNVGGIGQLLQAGTSWINQNVFGWLPAPVQPIATNTLVNTVLNGGDIKSALTSSLFTAGTNFLGKEIATALADVKGLEAIGGPNAVGRIAANAITTAVQGGDFSKIGINALSGIVGNTVAQQTGSKIAGQITAQLVNGMVQGADPMQMLTGIGASQLAQQLTGKVLPEGQARQLVTAYMTQVIKQAGQQALSGK